MPKPKLKRAFLHDLNTDERNAIADQADISRVVMRHYATSVVSPSAARAVIIEHAARSVGYDIRREDLAAGCATCEFAKRCRGSRG